MECNHCCYVLALFVCPLSAFPPPPCYLLLYTLSSPSCFPFLSLPTPYLCSRNSDSGSQRRRFASLPTVRHALFIFIARRIFSTYLLALVDWRPIFLHAYVHTTRRAGASCSRFATTTGYLNRLLVVRGGVVLSYRAIILTSTRCRRPSWLGA